jgi:hypothetical protein
MACIEWDSQHFYQPQISVPSSRMHSLSRNPKAAPAAAANMRPPGAATSIERDMMTAAHAVAQSTVIASSDQVELFPNQSQVSNGVGALKRFPSVGFSR